MKRLFIYKGLELEANINGYATYEVKTTKFEPSHIGQLGSYMVAVDHLLRNPGDNKTIGLLICKSKDKIEAQYALESSSQPIRSLNMNSRNSIRRS